MMICASSACILPKMMRPTRMKLVVRSVGLLLCRIEKIIKLAAKERGSRPTGLASLGLDAFARVAPHIATVGLGDVEPGWAQIDAIGGTPMAHGAIVTSPCSVSSTCDAGV